MMGMPLMGTFGVLKEHVSVQVMVSSICTVKKQKFYLALISFTSCSLLGLRL